MLNILQERINKFECETGVDVHKIVISTHKIKELYGELQNLFMFKKPGQPTSVGDENEFDTDCRRHFIKKTFLGIPTLFDENLDEDTILLNGKKVNLYV